ncbi:hypothetical protein ACFWUP_09295 [Nocardia sp. NPDC058658]|uniref:hypothetical protein n=1 Tax=Nocardia sp. NPDC058658 TaxID=3346580 RepID=UPI003658BAA0
MTRAKKTRAPSRAYEGTYTTDYEYDYVANSSKPITITDADDIRIGGVPVNEYIQRYHAEFESSSSDLGDLESRLESLKSKGHGIDDEKLAKSHRIELREAVKDAYKRAKKEGWRGPEPSSYPIDLRNEVVDWLRPRETDPPRVKEIKRWGLDFVNNRSNSNARQKKGELVAEAVAKYHLKKLGADIMPRTRTGAGTLDIIAVLDGKLIVVEAKTGTSGLGDSLVLDDNGNYVLARQGTRLYLRAKLREDPELGEWLKKNYPGILKGLNSLGAEGLDVTYYRVHSALVDAEDERGSPVKVLGASTIEQFAVGDNINFVHPPTPLVPYKKPTREEYRQGLSAQNTGGRRRRPSAATVSAALAMGGLGAAATVAAAVKHESPEPNPEIVSVAVVTPLTGQSTNDGSVLPSDSAQSSDLVKFGDGILSGLKSTIAECSRMATSFTSYVQNGLNDLVVMVGGAVAAVSGFVSDVIDSAGAQAIIEKVSDDWAFAQELLNIAMLFSPVGTIAAAISAAVLAIQLIVEHWDEIRAAFDWVLKNVLTPVAEFFMTAFKVYITPYRLAFDAVMAGFNGMGGVVGGAVGAVRSTVAGIVKAIGEIFQRLEINIGFPVNKSFGLKSVGDAMVAWASERLADGGLVGGQGRPAPRRGSGIEVMAVIDRSVLRAAQAEERKIGYAYRPPFLHDGALPRTDNGPGPRTFDVRVADVDAAFAQIRMLQAVQDARFSPVGV